jgi:hypothetical protein
MPPSGSSEKLPAPRSARNVDGRQTGSTMSDASYAEAKEIALARIELRESFRIGDRAAADAALARLVKVARDDDELAAEVRRWKIKLGAA